MAALVKICGITNAADAAEAASLGAEFVGLIFCPSPRQVSLDQARAIRGELASSTKLVGVFKDQPIELVNDIARDCKLDLVQLHGNEEPDYIRQVELPVIKVFTFEIGVESLVVRNGSKVISSFLPYAGASYFLFDKPKGIEVDDPLIPLKLLAERLRTERSLPPVFIAGALTDRIVQDALELTEPFAVDVASGVEQSPGFKSRELMERFISSVKPTANIGVGK
jgi:Phosphoribosylanthranilate isomerase